MTERRKPARGGAAAGRKGRAAGRAGKPGAGTQGTAKQGAPKPGAGSQGAGRRAAGTRGTTAGPAQTGGRGLPGAAASPDAPFRLGATPGATPGKWIDIWQERMPDVPLELVPLPLADQERALRDGEVDAALVRTPLADADALHVIPLYEELPVVVCGTDSALTAAEELTVEDLEGEVLIVPADDVLRVAIPGTAAPRFDAPETTADAIALAAAGIGVVVVPMSLARLHHRRDVAQRPLRGGPASPVALAWPAERTTPAVETFIGIVRGRTANSSRG